MTSIPEQRAAAVAATIARIRAIETTAGVTRESLDRIKDEMLALAAQEHLFPVTEFPHPPVGVQESRLYLLNRDPDDRFTLYMNSLNPGKSTQPHDHTTWAVVVAIEGDELNRVYRREDDGREPGRARLALDHEIVVAPGTGIALMPHDIHSIHTTGTVPTRHLHMYGLALDRLDQRVAFDLERGTVQPYNNAYLQVTVPAVETPAGR